MTVFEALVEKIVSKALWKTVCAWLPSPMRIVTSKVSVPDLNPQLAHVADRILQGPVPRDAYRAKVRVAVRVRIALAYAHCLTVRQAAAVVASLGALAARPSPRNPRAAVAPPDGKRTRLDCCAGSRGGSAQPLAAAALAAYEP